MDEGRVGEEGRGLREAVKRLIYEVNAERLLTPLKDT